MRCIVNGGEAAVARTARRFVELLAPLGLRARAMQPAWGMSETGSAATTLLVRRGVRRRGERGAAESWIRHPHRRRAGRALREGYRGQLQFADRTSPKGYFRNDADLSRDVHPTTAGSAPRPRAASTGCLRAIVGREKSVIIVNGVNYYAHEIEAAIADVRAPHPGSRRGIRGARSSIGDRRPGGRIPYDGGGCGVARADECGSRGGHGGRGHRTALPVARRGRRDPEDGHRQDPARATAGAGSRPAASIRPSPDRGLFRTRP